MDGLFDVTRTAKERMSRLKARLDREAPDIALEVGRGQEERSNKYSWVPQTIARTNIALRDKHPHLVADFNKYALLYAVTHFSLDESAYSIPSSVASLYMREFERIVHQVETFEDAFFDLANDQFLKDLAILTHRLIPVGAEFAEGGGGIPRRLVFAAGPLQCLTSLWFILFRCRGFSPFFALHTHTLALDDFNREGWLATYHRLAELLALNPRMKGWQSASWFLDPALETISPHLVHLRRVPVDNGAALLFVRHHGDGSSGALSKSKTRRRLFDEGKYIPATYMRVWPRNSIIAWSRRHGGGRLP